MKVVVNRRHGGFSLSHEAIMRYAEIKGMKVWPEKHPRYSHTVTYYTKPPEERMKDISLEEWHKKSHEERMYYNDNYQSETLYDREIPRDDPALVQVVEELGEKANGLYAYLEIVDILPKNIKWYVDDYDGAEIIREEHRSW